MTAVWLWMRLQAPRYVRAWLALALLLGIGFGGAGAAATGARRAATAFPRFVRAMNTPDVFTGGVTGDRDDVAMFDELERLPQVADSVRGYTPSFEVILPSGKHVGFPDLHTEVSPNPAAGRTIGGVKILAGRLPDPSRADEATVSFAALRFGIRLGQAVRVPITGPEGNAIDEGSVRIVGVHASPGDFPSINGTAFPAVFLPAGFYTAHRRAIETLNPSDAIGVGIKLKPGATPDDLRAEAQRRNIPLDFPVTTKEVVAGVQRSIRFEAVALWLLAGLLGLAVVAIVGQALARQTHVESADNSTLRALGMSTSQLFAVAMVRAAFVGAIAALVSVGAAILASPLTPIGLARIAEPSPGIAVDAPVLAIGALLVFLLTFVVAAFPAWRSAAPERGMQARRPSAFVSLFARVGAPASAVSGVRFAAESGRGRTAVPLRSATLGASIGIAALVVAVTFADSLTRLIDTPRYSGYRWDVLMGVGDEDAEAFRRILQADRSVEAFGRGGALNMSVGGRRLLGYAWDTPAMEPVMVDGRVPRGTREVALGPRTMRALGVRIGDTVPVKSLNECGDECPAPEDAVLRMRVVGKTIVPGFFFEAHEPGDGVALTVAASLVLNPSGSNGPQGQDLPFLARYKPGTDIDVATRRLSDAAGGFFFVKRQRSGDLESLSSVAHAPYVLAEMLALLALATMLHALRTSIRRRAHDIAILKTLGFVKRQVWATVAWQASVIALVALVVALPLGAAAGRLAWRIFADQLSVLPHPVTALSTVLWLIPITVVLANLIAVLPARAAARTQTALVLRTE